MHLKDLIICDYKYKVMPHFIMYPTLGPGQFLSLSGISFDVLLEKSKSWDKDKPLVESSELSRLYDLTDNDIIIRQINCSQILARLLEERVKLQKQYDFNGVNYQMSEHSRFNFERDFYGLDGYWTNQNSKSIRIAALILAIIYYPYKTIIDFFIYLQKYDMFNCLVMIKKKRYQMRQCENYLRILKHEKPTRNQNMFDFHFYKMAIYSKFASLLTQMVLDIILGFLFLIYLRTQTTSALNVLHYIGKGLQLEVLK